MPVHYTASKYRESIAAECTVAGAMKVLSQAPSWESMSKSMAEKASEPGKQRADRNIDDDEELLWENEEVVIYKQANRFKLKLSKGPRAKPPVRPAMPKVEGRLLANTTTTGVLLCPLFQNDSCKEGVTDRSCRWGWHACAVLRRNGRACSQAHAATQCNC